MKPYIFKCLPIIALVILITACGQTAQPPAALTVGDFFNFSPDTIRAIHSLDEEMMRVNQELFTMHISADGSRIQQRVLAYNIDRTIVLENRDGTIRQIFEWADHPIWEDITGIGEIMSLVILQEPLELGNTWLLGMEDGINEITGVDLELTTSLGTFTGVIQVTTTFPSEPGMYGVSYFAPGHGMISDSYTVPFQDSVTTFRTELVEEREGGLVSDMFVFDLDDQAMGIEYTELEVEVVTNQDFADFFTTVIQENIGGLGHVVVNSLVIDRDNQVMTVDFADNFFTPFAFGGGTETLMLYSLANTFGFFFFIPEVRITIAGENYVSGHLVFEEGETIPVGSGLGLW